MLLATLTSLTAAAPRGQGCLKVNSSAVLGELNAAQPHSWSDLR